MDAELKVLSAMRLGALSQRAIAVGATPEELAAAQDADDPKPAVIALIMGKSGAADQLRSDLCGLKLGQLNLRATAAGVGQDQRTAALDADAPKPAMIELIVAAEASPTGTAGAVQPEPQPHDVQLQPLSSAKSDAKTTVNDFLEQHNLDKYAPAMTEQGYDDVSFLVDAHDSELQAVTKKLNMPTPHARRFLAKVSELKDAASPGPRDVEYMTCLDRKFVQKEIEWAWQYNKTIITVFEQESHRLGYFDYSLASQKYKGTPWAQILHHQGIPYQRQHFLAKAMLEHIDAFATDLTVPPEDPSGPPWNFFLSHHQKTGGDQAQNLCSLFKLRGQTVWYDNEMVQVTEEAMEDGVKQCDYFVLLLTAEAAVQLPAGPMCLQCQVHPQLGGSDFCGKLCSDMAGLMQAQKSTGTSALEETYHEPVKKDRTPDKRTKKGKACAEKAQQEAQQELCVKCGAEPRLEGFEFCSPICLEASRQAFQTKFEELKQERVQRGIPLDAALTRTQSLDLLTTCPSANTLHNTAKSLLRSSWAKKDEHELGEVVSVQQINNARLRRQYDDYVSKLPGDGNEQHVFHGCSERALASIVERGFLKKYVRQEAWQRLGTGFYFAIQASKAHEYPLGSVDSLAKGHHTRHLLLCKVAQGKKFETEQDMPDQMAAPPGHHSVYAKATAANRLNYDELVIFEETAILPVAVVEYTFTKKKDAKKKLKCAHCNTKDAIPPYKFCSQHCSEQDKLARGEAAAFAWPTVGAGQCKYCGANEAATASKYCDAECEHEANANGWKDGEPPAPAVPQTALGAMASAGPSEGAQVAAKRRPPLLEAEPEPDTCNPDEFEPEPEPEPGADSTWGRISEAVPPAAIE